MELPLLRSIHDRYANRGFKIVVIDTARDTEGALAFIKEKDLPYIFLEDGEGEEDVVSGVYKQNSFPSSFLVGPEGKVYFFHQGYREGLNKQIEKELQWVLSMTGK